MEKYYLSKIRHSFRQRIAPGRTFSPVTLQVFRQEPPIMQEHVSAHSIFIKEKERFRKIDFDTILFVEALGSYCCVHLAEGRDLTLSFTLAEITPKLSASCFLRVHRSYIVNVDRIDAFIGNMLCIGKHRIPVSKQHRSEVMRQFNILGSSK